MYCNLPGNISAVSNLFMSRFILRFSHWKQDENNLDFSGGEQEVHLALQALFSHEQAPEIRAVIMSELLIQTVLCHAKLL